MNWINDLNAWVRKQIFCVMVASGVKSVCEGKKEKRVPSKKQKKKAECLHSMKCYGNSTAVPIFNNLNEYHLKTSHRLKTSVYISDFNINAKNT